MKKYVFDEVKGKYQGEMIIVEAETADEACEKAGMTEKIKDYQKFSTIDYSRKIYRLHEIGSADTIYVCRR